ncbi:carbohydrate kinase [Pelomonas sp. V22]|uniref:carbohydrate kinase family protein n=1 Tax=Pelomonas sp. V22 TaxID=2822139 RepID=UPI0024A96ED5|nr:carbohydrate kinase [Pelomonas sp. V22]MDI4632161.1 carbohydrate kinase [Pelomonas sp. V22]
MRKPLPRCVSFGEALTDLIRTGPDTWQSACGGAPWNVARALAGLGVASAFGGGISRDLFGQALWRESEAAGLDLRFLQQLDKPPLLAVVHETAPPQYFFIGEDSADLHFDPAALPDGWEAALDWAHFGCLGLWREPLAARLLALAAQLKAAGKRISYDPNFRAVMDEHYDPTLERMCGLVDAIKVSDEDLRRLFRSSDAAPGQAQLRAWAPTAWILLTRGAGIATLYRGDQQWSLMPPEVAVIDTVGAGDAAMAGLLASLMQQPPHQQSPGEQHLRWAVTAGALACTAAGAFAPDRQALLRSLSA